MTMFLSDFYRASDTVTTGSGSDDDLGNDFFIHALDRDEKGMLTYTKIRSINPTEIADFTRKDGTPYLDIATGLYDYVEETTEEKSLYNSPQDRYQQFRFDPRNYLISLTMMDFLSCVSMKIMIIPPKVPSKESK